MVINLEPEGPVKVQLMTLSRGRLVLLLCLMIVTLGGSIVFGSLLAPKRLQRYEEVIQLSGESVDSEWVKMVEFTRITEHLNTLHQKLWIQIYGRKKYDFQRSPTKIKTKFTAYIRETSEAAWKPSTVDRTYDRSMDCTSTSSLLCRTLTLFGTPYIAAPEYKFECLILLPKDLLESFDSTTLIISFLNDMFTVYETVLRFIFVVLTCIVATTFAWKLRHLSYKRDWIVEQKWTLTLLVLLMAFNNPLFAFNFIFLGWFFPFLDACFQATFVVGILIYWLNVADGIRGKSRSFGTHYLPKLLLGTLMWLSLVSLLAWEALRQAEDPAHPTVYEQSMFKFIELVYIFLFVLYIIYVLFIIVRESSNLRALPYLDYRLKFFVYYSFACLVVTMIGVFAAFAYGFHHAVTSTFFYAMFNSYVYVLAFLYSPVTGHQFTNLDNVISKSFRLEPSGTPHIISDMHTRFIISEEADETDDFYEMATLSARH